MTASAVARSPVLSISTTFAPRRCPAEREASSAADSARRQRSSSARSGSNVTMLTVSVTAFTADSGSRERLLVSNICRSTGLESPIGHAPSTAAPTPASAMPAREEKAVRYPADRLRAFAAALTERAGVRAVMARDVADVLLDGDLLGHTTHGLAL